MPYYEHVFIARQDLSTQQVDGLIADFSKIIEDNGGQVTKSENWGLRSLSYKISKNRKGHYVLLNLDSPAGGVTELERNARINEDILRYMTVRVEELEEGPSAVVRAKNSRDDRGPRRDRGERSDRGDRGDRGPRPERTER
ncbi:MAG: 30S ribosomal protein S6 [Sphingomonadales bacterium]